MEHSKQLGEESILKLLYKFSLPAIVGMLVNALYSVTDRIFIGNSAGALGIAGITLGFPIMLIMMAFTMLVGIGANSLVSIRLGEGKKAEAEHILGNAFILMIAVSLLLSVFGLIFLTPLLRMFGASDEVMPYAKSFMEIILLGAVFQGIGFGMNNFIRGEGNPKMAMNTMLLGAVLNAALCPIFIFGLGWGVRGSATATIIAQAVSSAWVLSYFVSGKSSLKLRRVYFRIDKDIMLKIFSLGSAPFVLQLAASIVNFILNKSLVLYGGDISISAMGIVMSVLTLIMMPLFGINQGVQPIIGYNYGARKFDRVKQALRLAILAATAIVVVGFAVIQSFAGQIIGLFNHTDAGLINLGAHAMRVFSISLPIVGFQIVGANYFQAIGKPKQAMFLSLSRQVLLLIPAVLILPMFFGLQGVFMAGPVSDLGSAMLTGVWIWRELGRLDDKHERSLFTKPQAE